MFTNERLFTIQAFTITRVHCIYVLLIVYNSGTAEGRQTGWGSTIIILFVFSSVYSTLCVAKLVQPIPPGSAGPTIKCQVSRIISWSVMVSYASDYFEVWHKKHKVIQSINLKSRHFASIVRAFTRGSQHSVQQLFKLFECFVLNFSH